MTFSRLWRPAALVLGLAVLLATFYAPHVERTRSAFVMNNDAPQLVVPFLAPPESTTPRSDYTSRYFREVFLPSGYAALWSLASQAGDPRAVAKVAQYAMMAAFLGLMGAAAYRGGGWLGGWVVVATLAGSGHVFGLMGGAHGHGFGQILAALIALSLVVGNAWGLAAACVLGAGLYPSVGVVAGGTLATVMALPRWLGDVTPGWSAARRLALVVGTALAALAAAAPQVVSLGGSEFGPATPIEDPAYPEYTREGRHRWPAAPVADIPSLAAERVFRDGRLLFGSSALTGALLLGFALSLRRDERARRLAAWAGVSVLVCVFAELLSPYLWFPKRYLRYLPTALVASVPISLSLGLRLLEGRAALRAAAPPLVAAAAFAIALTAPVRVAPETGLTRDVTDDADVFAHIETLPADATLAGWPRGLMDTIPYVTRREAFLNHENHLPFHRDYLLEMRRRMHALIDAYFAVEPGPLQVLRDEFGVGYLLVDARHFGPRPPRYFAPFDDDVDAAWRQGREDARPFLVLSLAAREGTWRRGPLALIDLDEAL